MRFLTSDVSELSTLVPVTSFENALFNKYLFNQHLLSVALFKALKLPTVKIQK